MQNADLFVPFICLEVVQFVFPPLLDGKEKLAVHLLVKSAPRSLSGAETLHHKQKCYLTKMKGELSK